ncbi:hypothetical protein AB1N83_014139 [Pleurotus pulmonarius]
MLCSAASSSLNPDRRSTRGAGLITKAHGLLNQEGERGTTWVMCLDAGVYRLQTDGENLSSLDLAPDSLSLTCLNVPLHAVKPGNCLPELNRGDSFPGPRTRLTCAYRRLHIPP